MKRFTLAAVMCVICVALTACGGGGGGSDDYTPSVYVAGAVKLTSAVKNACYWKDGVRTDLPGSDGNAYGIAVANGHVYVVGNTTSNACVWVDGVKEDLDGDYAWGIKIVGNTVYISGTNNDSKACIWIDGIKYDIDSSTYSSSANNINVVNDTIYVTGDRSDDGSIYKATLWSKA
ncbi:MAG: hypothetical protein QHH74_16775 [Spirochaetota bacterium]|nr:hypothetical protein [Spirochaetota bacterium]